MVLNTRKMLHEGDRVSEPCWEDLSDSARGMLHKTMLLLASRFSGRIEIACVQGGVKYMSVTHTYQPKDLSLDAES